MVDILWESGRESMVVREKGEGMSLGGLDGDFVRFAVGESRRRFAGGEVLLGGVGLLEPMTRRYWIVARGVRLRL